VVQRKFLIGFMERMKVKEIQTKEKKEKNMEE
jgi:hypothetical protein